MAGETDLRLDEAEDTPGIPHQVLCTTLDKLRGLVRSYQARQQHQTAPYWADKQASLACGDQSDVYVLAMALLQTKLLHMASRLVRNSGLHIGHLRCCLAAALAFHLAGDQEEALYLLEEGEAILRQEEQI